MRPYFTERADGLASLALARLRAGGVPPLDWAAAAIDRGRLLCPPARSPTPRGLARLRRLGLLGSPLP